MIDFLGSTEFAAWSRTRQADYLREVLQRFRREFPDDPDTAQIGLLVAEFIHKAREEALARSHLN